MGVKLIKELPENLPKEPVGTVGVYHVDGDTYFAAWSRGRRINLKYEGQEIEVEGLIREAAKNLP